MPKLDCSTKKVNQLEAAEVLILRRITKILEEVSKSRKVIKTREK